MQNNNAELSNDEYLKVFAEYPGEEWLLTISEEEVNLDGPAENDFDTERKAA